MSWSCARHATPAPTISLPWNRPRSYYNSTIFHRNIKGFMIQARVQPIDRGAINQQISCCRVAPPLVPCPSTLASHPNAFPHTTAVWSLPMRRAAIPPALERVAKAFTTRQTVRCALSREGCWPAPADLLLLPVLVVARPQSEALCLHVNEALCLHVNPPAIQFPCQASSRTKLWTRCATTSAALCPWPTAVR